MAVYRSLAPFVLVLCSLLSAPALVHAVVGYTPFSAMGASSIMVEGKAFYIQGGVSNGQDKRVALRQTFSIDLSRALNISQPSYTAMADGMDDSYYPGTLLNDNTTWFMIHRNKTVFYYNLSTQTITPKGLVANYSAIEGLGAFINPKTNDVIVPNGYWSQSGPFTTLNISSAFLQSQQLAPLPGTNALQYYASAWSASENAYYVFGGWNQVYSGDLVRFDLTNNKWSNITAPGAPAARDVACMASAYGGTKLVLFGGESPTGKVVLSEIYIFDVVNGTWLQGPNGGANRARAGAVCGVSGDLLVLWGGYTDLTARGPVHEILSVYNLKTNTWQNPDDLGVGDGSGSAPNVPSPTSSGPNIAAIAGGVVAAAVILATVVLFLYRRKKANGADISPAQTNLQDGSSEFRKDDFQLARQPLGHTRSTNIAEPGYKCPSSVPRNPVLISEEEYKEEHCGPQRYPGKTGIELDDHIEAQIEKLQDLIAQKNAVEGKRRSRGPQEAVYNTYGFAFDNPHEAPRGPQANPPPHPVQR